ncbi:CPBP family intramembrane glutamic endopeptidase [Undibacterium sp.]|uniref:CPBP family intramembrane glutamic endopeptidase n=1 Tax=Undibacterium sp. TaxID=1914977 RepID=UPI003750706E
MEKLTRISLPFPVKSTKDLLVILFFCVILQAILQTYLPKIFPPYYQTRITQYFQFISLIALCIFVLNLRIGTLVQQLGELPNFRDVVQSIFIGLALFAFTLGENALEVIIFSQFNLSSAYNLWNFHPDRHSVLSFFTPAIQFNVLLLVVIGPIAEEFFFRGMLFTSIAHKRSYLLSSIYVSLVFLLLHLMSQYFISTFIFSMTLCFFYLITRSVYLCAIVHGTYNFIAFIHQHYFDIQYTRPISHISKIDYWLPQLAMLVASSLVLGILYVKWYRKFKLLG